MSKKKTIPKAAFPLKVEKVILEKVRIQASEENRSANNYIETVLKEKLGIKDIPNETK